MHRLLTALLAAVIATATLSGCSAADSSPQVTPAALTRSDALEWVSTWQSQHATTIDWAECDGVPGADCATMTVPLDWSDPAGTTIDLPLRRHPSPDDSAPLLLLSGGPGGRALSSSPTSQNTTMHYDRHTR